LHFTPGLEGWIAAGGPVASDLDTRPALTKSTRMERTFDRISSWSAMHLAAAWLGAIVLFALAYWLLGWFHQPVLYSAGEPLPRTWDSFWTCLYFSLVTATSVGFGDVVPTGPARALAVIEAASELLLFGVLISRLIARRQDQLLEEVHRIGFEDRVSRVRMNLHAVLQDLQELAQLCRQPEHDRSRWNLRIVSLLQVLVGELRTVHALLYRSAEHVEETLLQALLSNLAACLDELGEIRRCASADLRGIESIASSLKIISQLSDEICGECVPRKYADDLKQVLDRVQSLGHALNAA
jgi:potassium channel LctB